MHPLPLRRGLLIGLAGLALHAEASAGGGDATAIRYGRDIRPLLADRCFRCHGPDSAKRQADLRLDEREVAVAERDGVTAIAPGDPGSSDLWRRVTSADPEERMPPPPSHKRPLDAGEL